MLHGAFCGVATHDDSIATEAYAARLIRTGALFCLGCLYCRHVDPVGGPRAIREPIPLDTNNYGGRNNMAYSVTLSCPPPLGRGCSARLNEVVTRHILLLEKTWTNLNALRETWTNLDKLG